MEPWDGPASIAFTDGTVMGAVLDRNGLRPSRYWVTDDDLVIMASEVGVLDIDPATVVEKGRLQPGRMFLVDTTKGRIVGDDEIKAELAAAHPYQRVARRQPRRPRRPAPPRPRAAARTATSSQRQQVFGYTTEELKILIEPMARTGAEPIGSMGTDTPDRGAVATGRGCCSTTSPSCSPRSPTRRSTPSARSWSPAIGGIDRPRGQPARPAARRRAARSTCPARSSTTTSWPSSRTIDAYDDLDDFRSVTIPCLFPVAEGGDGLRRALDRRAPHRRPRPSRPAPTSSSCPTGDSDAETWRPIPSLLFTSAVHHHLIREKTRTQVGLVVETRRRPRGAPHVPAARVRRGGHQPLPGLRDHRGPHRRRASPTITDPRQGACSNYIKACGKGVLKVMSKMGISTVASYTGAQIFEAIGLSQDLVDEYFTGTVSRLGGVGLDELADEVAVRHRLAYPRPPRGAGPPPRSRSAASTSGAARASTTCSTRRRVQAAARHPHQALRDLQGVHAARSTTRPRSWPPCAACSGFRDRRAPAGADRRGRAGQPRSSSASPPAPCRYGSISAEAHETLAIAMNRLGGKSNTGEGGEDPDRFVPDANGDLRRSAIKQVASGRFGVTSEYLVNADDLQIKMAQGAKPGEGGQLPGHKVYPWIAKTRHSTPGVGLIRPPPHHDIYSIEDLAQLIHDLKNANPAARVHVKLVAEVGVGTVAAGVSKAHADVVLISGHDGGTGASPLTSLKHAGAPWELGLAETQQTLLLNGLRDRIVVQVDGQMKTGRDVVIAALLGGRGVRLRHRPAGGVGLRDDAGLPPRHLPGRRRHPEPRAAQARFTGKPEFVENFFELHRRGGARAARRARASARWPRPSATSSCSTPPRPSTTGRPPGLDLAPDPARARAARGHPPAPGHRPGPRPRPGARPRSSSRSAGRPLERGAPVRHRACPSAT